MCVREVRSGSMVTWSGMPAIQKYVCISLRLCRASKGDILVLLEFTQEDRVSSSYVSECCVQRYNNKLFHITWIHLEIRRISAKILLIVVVRVDAFVVVLVVKVIKMMMVVGLSGINSTNKCW